MILALALALFAGGGLLVRHGYLMPGVALVSAGMWLGIVWAFLLVTT